MDGFDLKKKKKKQSPEILPEYKAASRLFDWLDNILFGLIFVIALFAFVFKTYTVEGDSMRPNFKTGDYVLAYSLFYTPQPGDVVIIDASNNYHKALIKRVVAVGGQTVAIDEDGTIRVDGVVFPYDGTNPENARHGNATYPLYVPEGYVFVMGDNRGNSLDSRFSALGLVDVRSIVGHQIYNLK